MFPALQSGTLRTLFSFCLSGYQKWLCFQNCTIKVEIWRGIRRPFQWAVFSAFSSAASHIFTCLGSGVKKVIKYHSQCIYQHFPTILIVVLILLLGGGLFRFSKFFDSISFLAACYEKICSCEVRIMNHLHFQTALYFFGHCSETLWTSVNRQRTASWLTYLEIQISRGAQQADGIPNLKSNWNETATKSLKNQGLVALQTAPKRETKGPTSIWILSLHLNSIGCNCAGIGWSL